MLKSGLENAKKIGASCYYLYANQSNFKNQVEYLKLYNRDIWINELVRSFSRNENMHIEQLFPGAKLFTENIPVEENSLFNVSPALRPTLKNIESINGVSADELNFYVKCLGGY